VKVILDQAHFFNPVIRQGQSAIGRIRGYSSPVGLWKSSRPSELMCGGLP